MGDDSGGAGSLGSRLLALPIAGLLLFLFAQGWLHSPCWGLFFLVALVAWPIWFHRQEFLLFQRRALLARAAHADSGLRRWLWSGRLSRMLQVGSALVWAALLLAFATLLKPVHWLVLAADLLLLALMVGPVRRLMASQVREPQVGVLARRWPLLLINLSVLGVAFLWLDFFVVGATDTRQLSWHAVAEQALDEYAGAAACPLSGLLVGVLAAVERLSWHLWQVLVPALPDLRFRLAAWGIFLLQAGVFAYAFTRFQLGIVALLEARKLRLAAITGDSSFSRAFFLTILILAIPYLYAAYKLRGFDPGSLQDEAREVLAWANPCTPDAAAMQTLERRMNSEVAAARADARAQAGAQVDAMVEQLFAEAGRGVDAYLDWYFTVIGEYERLAAVAVGDLGELMAAQLERHLFDETGFGGRLASVDESIADAYNHQMMALNRRLDGQLEASVRGDRCGLGELDLSAFAGLERDGMRASAAAGGGALVAISTSKLVAKKTAAAVVAKVAAKESFATAAAVVGKVSAKKGGSVLLAAAGATALCAPGGPLAAVCGVVVGAATWLALDKALVEVDEKVFREQMRDDILAVLEQQRGEVAQAMKEQHFAAIDVLAAASQRAASGAFIPARDGL